MFLPSWSCRPSRLAEHREKAKKYTTKKAGTRGKGQRWRPPREMMGKKAFARPPRPFWRLFYRFLPALIPQWPCSIFHDNRPIPKKKSKMASVFFQRSLPKRLSKSQVLFPPISPHRKRLRSPKDNALEEKAGGAKSFNDCFLWLFACKIWQTIHGSSRVCVLHSQVVLPYFMQMFSPHILWQKRERDALR